MRLVRMCQPLVPFLCKHSAADPLEHLTLDHPDPFDNEFVPEFFKIRQCSSPEEDKGMSEPVALPAKGVLVHESIGGSLVVRG